MSQSKPEVIPLNLIFDYPVYWSKFKVLRDLLQNFYDAVGHGEWYRRFSRQWMDERLLLKADGVGFSYDWLLHIGASTKREHPDEYAGYFGEGFKIAALCALRDHGWQIQLASRDWRLQVSTEKLLVEDRELTSLAYRIWRGEPYRADTVLRIKPFRETDQGILECAFLSFYSKENPLFGEKIWSSSEGAIFLRSKRLKPPGYPTTGQARGCGIVFAGYQALGSMELPLVVCTHRFRWNDRERNSFFRMDVVRAVHQVVANLPAEAAMRVLPYFRRWWYHYPRRRYDFDSWYRVVHTLARQVSRSPEQTKRWRERYPHLLIATPVKRADPITYNRRRQALDWLRRDERGHRLVQDGFAALGYAELEIACETADGFSVTRPPIDRERRLIEVLENFVNRLFSGWFGFGPLPSCRVLTHDRAVWMGMAVCIPRRELVKNPQGWVIRYELSSIALKPGLFRAERGSEALSTYLHELAHCFGGDQSAAFGQALTGLLEALLDHPEDLVGFRHAWEERCRADTVRMQDDLLEPAVPPKDWNALK